MSIVIFSFLLLKSLEADAFTKAGLQAHNNFRKIHGVPAIKLNGRMSKEAEEYAKKLAQSGILKHSSSKYGENLAMGCSSKKGFEMKAEEATRNWYKEVCEPGYDFTNGAFGTGTGHFTQVVWKQSVQLGIGKGTAEKDGMYCTYIVGRYDPPGNYKGKFKDNVPKGEFTKDVCDKIDDYIKDISSGGKTGAGAVEGTVGGSSSGAGAGKGRRFRAGAGITSGATAGAGEAGGAISGGNGGANRGGSANVGGIGGGNNGVSTYAGGGVGGTGGLGLKTGNEVSGNGGNAGGLRAGNEAAAGQVDLAGQGGGVAQGGGVGQANIAGQSDVNEQIAGGVQGDGISQGFGGGQAGGAGQAGGVAQGGGAGQAAGGVAPGGEAAQGGGAVQGGGAPQAGGLVQGARVGQGGSVSQGGAAGGGQNSQTTQGGGKSEGENVGKGDSGSGKLGKGAGNTASGGAFVEGGNPNSAESESGGLSSGEENTSPSNDGSLTFDVAGLKAHNIFRKLHKARPMKLNAEMSTEAQQYAEELASKGTFEHSTSGDGENLAMGCKSEPGADMTAEEATKNWYKEVCEPGYDFTSAAFDSGTGHFTQVVWKASVQLGLGKATGKKDGMYCTYIVGRYRPPGNYQGQFLQNIEKGTFQNADCKKLDDFIKDIGQAPGSQVPGQGAPSVQGSKDVAEGGPDEGEVTAGSKDEKQSFEVEAMHTHNHFRGIHDAEALKLNKEMCKEAQDYAETIAKKGVLEHSQGGKDGENLAMKCLGPGEKEPTGTFATDLWYEEVCNPGYDFQSSKFNMQTGHFTQVVWKKSKELGIGKATATHNGIPCTYVVGRYRPPGNYEGKFDDNVVKGSFNKGMCKELEQGTKRNGIARKGSPSIRFIHRRFINNKIKHSVYHNLKH